MLVTVIWFAVYYTFLLAQLIRRFQFAGGTHCVMHTQCVPVVVGQPLWVLNYRCSWVLKFSKFFIWRSHCRSRGAQFATASKWSVPSQFQTKSSKFIRAPHRQTRTTVCLICSSRRSSNVPAWTRRCTRQKQHQSTGLNKRKLWWYLKVHKRLVVYFFFETFREEDAS